MPALGMAAEGKIGDRAHPLDNAEYGLRAVAAVAADGVRAPGGDSDCGLFGGGAVEAISFRIDGDHDDEGEIWSDRFRGANSLLGFGQ